MKSLLSQLVFDPKQAGKLGKIKTEVEFYLAQVPARRRRGGQPGSTSFEVKDIQKEFQRLKNLGVEFKQEPTQMGPVTQAVFDDTCGNLIQIYQV